MLSAVELLDLSNAISERCGDNNLLALLAYANRTDALDEMLESIGMDDLLGNGTPQVWNKKILVIGQALISVDKLRSVVRQVECLDVDDFEFHLGYKDMMHRFDYSDLRHSDKYGAIIVGPQPHCTAGKGDSSSGIVEMESHPDIYPPVIRCVNERGVLEISKNSFKKALVELLDRVA